VIVAKPVAIATWSIGAPPAGGEAAAASMVPPSLSGLSQVTFP
jgi:hypothetical protein